MTKIENRNEEMTWEDDDPELGLRNPYSMITCFVLYLYSLEVGIPPFYAEVNRVARDMDLAYLNTLGPFLKVLSCITASAEAERDHDDKIKTGKMICDESAGDGFNIAGMFVLFRGAPMREKWIEPYEEQAGQLSEVYLPGNISCSRDPMVALGFAHNSDKEELIPVFFVITCQNFFSPAGIRMNNEAYTSYPVEDEYLLMEGCNVYILSIEKNVQIDNDSSDMTKFNKRSMTVIHMFHPSF